MQGSENGRVVTIVELLALNFRCQCTQQKRCHRNSVNTRSPLPICSDVKTRKRWNVVGIDSDNIHMDTEIEGSMNDNIHMDTEIEGSMNDNIDMNTEIEGSMNDNIHMDTEIEGSMNDNINMNTEIEGANSLKQRSTDRHIAPFGHIILIPSKPVFQDEHANHYATDTVQ